MEDTIQNTYLFKALDAYPYELEETVEALNYALSYNSKNTHALCLMGRVYAEQLQDYETAKQYYANALASNIEMPETYAYYIETLLFNEDYKEAEKLITFAFSIKGVNKALLFLFKGLAQEKQHIFKQALKNYKMALKTSTDDCFSKNVENDIKRIKKKIKPKKKKKHEQKK